MLAVSRHRKGQRSIVPGTVVPAGPECVATLNINNKGELVTMRAGNTVTLIVTLRLLHSK